jgi:transposase
LDDPPASNSCHYDLIVDTAQQLSREGRYTATMIAAIDQPLKAVTSIATRCLKLAAKYPATVTIAAIMLWL